MDKTFTMEVPAEHEYLKVVRNFFTQCVKVSGFKISDNDTTYLEMAINEFCENIVRHGYKDSAGDMLIKVQVNDLKIKTIIIDSGEEHNILEYDPIAKETLVQKGIQGKLGIRMIKTICDKIEYKRLKGKNRTTLIKKTRP